MFECENWNLTEEVVDEGEEVVTVAAREKKTLSRTGKTEHKNK